MAEIKIISVSTITAINCKESTRIELTPWDLQFLLVGYIQKGLLFHKPQPSQEPTLITCLQDSLSHTLEIFSPLAGRLATDIHEDGKVSYYIDCNNAGVEFVHAAALGTTIADILESPYTPEILYSFFTLNGASNCEGTSKPLLAVQVTELTDGVFIGCTVNHTVADGTSFWHFFNTWSAISRGSDYKTKPPAFKRRFLDGVEYPIRISLPSNDNICLPSPSPSLPKERVFHFTKEIIGKLKAKANADMGTNRISSLQALLAYLWRSVVRNQDLDNTQEVHCHILIGARQRLRSEFPGQYFGNALQVGTVTMKAGELREHGLGYVAMQMNNVVALHTEEKLKGFLKSWMENPRIFSPGEVLNINALATSSSPRFDTYGNDFGWGKPLAVRSGLANKREGKITLFSGVEEGSVDIEVCHRPETLEGMVNDPEFVTALNI